MNASRSRVLLVAAIWSVFFVFGFQLAGMGPLISVFAGRTHVSIESIGILFTVQSLASLISAASIGTVIERFTIRPAILIGLVSVAVGLFGIMVTESFPVLLFFGAIGGFGVGYMDAGGQLLIMSIFGDKSARPLNSLHFLFSVGAVIGLFLAVRFGVAMLWVAVVILIGILPVMFMLLPSGIRAGGSAGSASRPANLYRSPVLWMFAVIILLYVGLEIGVGGWTTEYLAGTTTLTRETAGLITSIYWLTFMLSRLVVTAFGNRLTFERQLIMGIGLSIVGGIGYVLTVGSVGGAVVSTIILGFAFGPVYPAVFAIVTKRFSGAAGRAAGVIGAAGSIGAMVIVPLQGVLLERASGQVMTIYIAALAVGMLAFFALANRGSAHIEPAPAPVS